MGRVLGVAKFVCLLEDFGLEELGVVEETGSVGAFWGGALAGLESGLEFAQTAVLTLTEAGWDKAVAEACFKSVAFLVSL